MNITVLDILCKHFLVGDFTNPISLRLQFFFEKIKPKTSCIWYKPDAYIPNGISKTFF